MKWCGLLNCKGEYCFLEEEFNVDYLRSREEIVPKCGHSCPSHTHTHTHTHAHTSNTWLFILHSKSRLFRKF